MKKSILLLMVACFFLAGQSNVFAQKAKFKSKLSVVQKTKLPTNYIDAEKRTYDLYTKGSYAEEIDPHQKRLWGWKKDTENPKVKGVVSIYGFSVNSPKLSSQKKEKKNEDGKVTDRWTEYSYTNSARGNGTLYVYGASNEFKYNKPNKKKSKYEKKKEEEAAAKKKDLADNPFLSADDIEEAGESDIGTDEGLDGEALPLVTKYDVSQTKEIKTKAYRSKSKAYEDYKNQRSALYDFKNAYPDAAYHSAISSLNAMYGYAPVKQSFYIKKMKTEKHPEYKTWNDAAQAAQTLFKSVKYNQSIDATSTKFDPIIKYYADMVEKSNGDKKAKKLNKAAFKNLTNIMYYLDRHEDLMTVAKNNLDSKYLDKTAERILEKCHKQKALLMFHNMNTSHVESAEEVSEDDFESEEAEKETDDN